MRKDEKEIEKYLTDRIKQIGGVCWKFTSPGTAGVPDRLILYRGRTLFVETKAKDGRLSKIQKIRRQQIRFQQLDSYTISSREEVDELVRMMEERYGF